MSIHEKVAALLGLHPSSKLVEVASKAVSVGTWNARMRVAVELARLSGSFEDRTFQFLSNRIGTVQASTVAKDIGHVRWVAARVQATSPTLAQSLSVIQKGLRLVEAQQEVKHKALPMSRELLFQLVEHPSVSKPTALALLLAFMSGSRVGDVFALNPHKSIRPHRGGSALLLLWGVTKTHRTVEARADHQQIIDEPGPLLELLRSPDLLGRTSPQEVDQALLLIRPTPDYVKRWRAANPTVELRNHFTRHSLKRGRAAELWELAARGQISVDRLRFELKHQSIECALAYAPSPSVTATAIRLANEHGTPPKSRQKPRPSRP